METVTFEETAEGTRIPVRVIPRANRTAIDGVHDGALRVRLKAPPVDGAANKALCDFFAKTLRCPRRDVQIVRGERSRTKVVLVRGVRAADIHARLQPD